MGSDGVDERLGRACHRWWVALCVGAGRWPAGKALGWKGLGRRQPARAPISGVERIPKLSAVQPSSQSRADRAPRANPAPELCTRHSRPHLWPALRGASAHRRARRAPDDPTARARSGSGEGEAPAAMRPLTEDETRVVFEKLHKFIGKNIKALVDRPDAPHCLRLQKNRVFYVREDLMRLATNVSGLGGGGSGSGEWRRRRRLVLDWLFISIYLFRFACVLTPVLHSNRPPAHAPPPRRSRATSSSPSAPASASSRTAASSASRSAASTSSRSTPSTRCVWYGRGGLYLPPRLSPLMPPTFFSLQTEYHM
jgi:hypothetical protein